MGKLNKKQWKIKKDINRAYRLERKARLMSHSLLKCKFGIADWWVYFDDEAGEWKDDKYEMLYARWSEYEHDHCKKAFALWKMANDLRPLPF